jgi:vacuolar-type H+-ATPase subunit H
MWTQVDDARGKFSEAQAKARDYKERTGKEMNQAIDKFDNTVEKKASEAKSGISSWFGGK